MNRCEAKTRNGRQCKNKAMEGKHYCHRHWYHSLES